MDGWYGWKLLQGSLGIQRVEILYGKWYRTETGSADGGKKNCECLKAWVWIKLLS